MNLTLQPSVLRWARERAGLDAEALAKKVGLAVDRIRFWEESGELRFNQAEKLARVTHTPFGYLYLATPPVEKLPVPDFRTVGSEEVQRPSPELLDVLDEAQRRQDWFRDYLVTNGAEPLPFVGSLNIGLSPQVAAARICAQLGITTELRAQARLWEDALRNEVERIEDSGVLIMRSGIVGNNTHRPLDVDEFRGFALSDRYAPLIFLNAKDAKGAQMFTLMHELVHLWLGLTGVSNLEDTYAPDRDTERFCNAVAAEILVPENELRDRWALARRQADPMASLTAYFKVSSLVLLRRLRDLNFIDRETFLRRYREEEARFVQIAAQKSGGGDFYRTQRTRSGERFAKALIESTLEGRTPYRDAMRLLGMTKVETFNRFARELEFIV
jgi:Zn-dependent peptidase ImmA (M78 family)